MCATQSRVSIRSLASPTPTVLWRSQTSRKLHNTTASTSGKRRGTTSELIPRRNKSRLQQQEEKMMETRTAVERIAGFTIVAAAVAVVALLAVLIPGPIAYAQDKYTLQSPSGIAFSD